MSNPIFFSNEDNTTYEEERNDMLASRALEQEQAEEGLEAYCPRCGNVITEYNPESNTKYNPESNIACAKCGMTNQELEHRGQMRYDSE